MNWLDVISVVGIAILVVMAIGLGRMGWRIWHNNEQMEPGGSMGDQMLGLGDGAFSKRAKRPTK